MGFYSYDESWSEQERDKFNRLDSQKEKVERKFLRLCGKDKFFYWNHLGMHPNYVEVESAKDFRPDLYELLPKLRKLDEEMEGMGAISVATM